MNGYAGKILRIDLTTRQIGVIPSKRYESWVGGHGIGSAIFFDVVVREKKADLEKIDGFDPANIVTIMTSPISGTLVPAGAGRTEVQGLGVQSYPIGWFTRSNFGGRFSSQLKYAQWDGIVLEGASKTPVWVDIRDDQVAIRECSELSLWGTDTWECQQIIVDYVGSASKYKDWLQLKGAKEKITQRPAVLAIGQAGENRCRIACLIHDSGNGSGQGGFGAVWGSKNLKAISVIGSGGINVADPNALIQARIHQKKNYQFNLRDLKKGSSGSEQHYCPPMPDVAWGKMPAGHRPLACIGCHSGCRGRYEDGIGNESQCVDSDLYSDSNSVDIARRASDLANRYGINAFELINFNYLRALNKKGILGPGKQIDTGDLDFKSYGTLEFYDHFLRTIAYREGRFGQALAEGFVRAAKTWGRLEEDLRTGLLPYPCWGLPEHYDPRAELEWGYGTIMGDRDINEHDFNGLFWDPTEASVSGKAPQVSAEEAAQIYTEKMIPYEGDMLMLDYSSENMYSEHIAKLVSWHRHYTRFWKQSVLFCDSRWADFVNLYAPDKKGSTGEAEPRFLNAVIGKKMTFLQGMELGRKIWNLDNAIWTLQGRHRDMVHFAEYIYKEPFAATFHPIYLQPGREDGKWKYIDVVGRHLDKAKFEEWKTRFYKIEGWDPNTGHPTRSTLEEVGLIYVADMLDAKDKLGRENKAV